MSAATISTVDIAQAHRLIFDLFAQGIFICWFPIERVLYVRGRGDRSAAAAHAALPQLAALSDPIIAVLKVIAAEQPQEEIP